MNARNSYSALALVMLVYPAAVGCRSVEGYVSSARVRAEFEEADVDASGFALGISGGASDSTAVFAELRRLNDGDVDVEANECLVGARSRALGVGPFDVRAQLDFGVSSVDVTGFRNSNELVSFGLGIRPELWLGSNVAVVAGFGYRYYVDTTEPTTCNDGTTSSSTGPGTCSHHRGVAHANDQVGDGGGFEFSVG